MSSFYRWDFWLGVILPVMVFGGWVIWVEYRLRKGGL